MNRIPPDHGHIVLCEGFILLPEGAALWDWRRRVDCGKETGRRNPRGEELPARKPLNEGHKVLLDRGPWHRFTYLYKGLDSLHGGREERRGGRGGWEGCQFSCG